jgi:hypothetical protein
MGTYLVLMSDSAALIENRGRPKASLRSHPDDGIFGLSWVKDNEAI